MKFSCISTGVAIIFLAKEVSANLLRGDERTLQKKQEIFESECAEYSGKLNGMCVAWHAKGCHEDETPTPCEKLRLAYGEDQWPWEEHEEKEPECPPADNDPCNPNPCQNGGSCGYWGDFNCPFHPPTTFVCNCPPGYTGEDCSEEEPDCNEEEGGEGCG